MGFERHFTSEPGLCPFNLEQASPVSAYTLTRLTKDIVSRANKK